MSFSKHIFLKNSEMLENPNPSFHKILADRAITENELDNDQEDKIDTREIYDISF